MKSNPKTPVIPSDYPLTMYMLQKGKHEEGRSSRPSLRLSTNRNNSKSISSLIKPWKKDTSRIANTSTKRIYAFSSNIELTFKQRVDGIISSLSSCTNHSSLEGNNNPSAQIEKMLNLLNEAFLHSDSEFQKFRSARSTFCNLTENEVMMLIAKLVQIFQGISNSLTKGFLQEQERVLHNYQQTIANLGKQYEEVKNKLCSQEKITKSLKYQLKQMVKISQQQQKKGEFVSGIFEEMEKKGIHIEQWVFQSDTFKNQVEQQGFLRAVHQQTTLGRKSCKKQPDSMQTVGIGNKTIVSAQRARNSQQ